MAILVSVLAIFFGRSEATFWKKKFVEVIPDDCNCVCPPNKYFPVEVPHTQLKYYPVEEGHFAEELHDEVHQEQPDGHEEHGGYENLPDKIGKQVYEIIGSALEKGGSSKHGPDEGVRKYADSKTSKPHYQSRTAKSGTAEKSHSEHAKTEHNHSSGQREKSHTEAEEHSGGGEGGDVHEFANHLHDSQVKEEEPAIVYHRNSGPGFDSDTFEPADQGEEGEPQNIESLYGSFDSSSNKNHMTAEADMIEAATTESILTAGYPSESYENLMTHDSNTNNKKKKYHKYDLSPKRRLSKKEQESIKPRPKSVIVHSKWHFFKEDPSFKSISGGGKKKSFTVSSAYKYKVEKSSSSSTSSPSTLNGHFMKKEGAEGPSLQEAGKGSKIVLSKMFPSQASSKDRKIDPAGNVRRATNQDAIVVQESERSKKIETVQETKKRRMEERNKQNRINVDGNFLKEPFMVRNTNHARQSSKKRSEERDNLQIKDWETAPKEDLAGSGFIYSSSTSAESRHFPLHGQRALPQRQRMAWNSPSINPFHVHESNQMALKTKPLESGTKVRVMFPEYY